MFKHLFNSLAITSYHTELLEACEWDDERANYLIDEFCKIVNEVADSYIDVVDSETPGFLTEIKTHMSSLASDSEIDILIKLLSETLRGKLSIIDIDN